MLTIRSARIFTVELPFCGHSLSGGGDLEQHQDGQHECHDSGEAIVRSARRRYNFLCVYLLVYA